MDIESDGGGSAKKEAEGVERGTAFNAERNSIDPNRPSLDPKDQNVGRLDRGQGAPMAPPRARGGLFMPTFASASRVTQVSPLGELLEIELLAVVVVDDINCVLAAPDLEVRDGRHSGRRHTHLWARRTRSPLEYTVEVAIRAEPGTEPTRLRKDDLLVIRRCGSTGRARLRRSSETRRQPGTSAEADRARWTERVRPQQLGFPEAGNRQPRLQYESRRPSRSRMPARTG